MTEKHPLTDEIIDTFASTQYDVFEEIGGIDLGYDYDDLRSAADWQLEQVIEWVSKFGWYLFEYPYQKHEFISELKKAMRP